jgi:hypothetical protein
MRSTLFPDLDGIKQDFRFAMPHPTPQEPMNQLW